MIEKKTMGYVDFEYPQYEAVAATVIVDTETGKVETYNQGDDEWYKPDEKDRFYPTLEEANAAYEAQAGIVFQNERCQKVRRNNE